MSEEFEDRDLFSLVEELEEHYGDRDLISALKDSLPTPYRAYACLDEVEKSNSLRTHAVTSAISGVIFGYLLAHDLISLATITTAFTLASYKTKSELIHEGNELLYKNLKVFSNNSKF